MYNLTVEFSWGDYIYENVIQEKESILSTSGRGNIFTVYFTNETDKAKGLLLDLSDEPGPVTFKFKNNNEEHIYHYCRLFTSEYKDNITSLTFSYGTTN